MKSRGNSPKMQRNTSPRLALEPRIVFDAAVAATGAELLDNNSDAAAYLPPAVSELLRDATVIPVKEAAPEHVKEFLSEGENDSPRVSRVEIVFIDSVVHQSQTIVASSNTEVIILQAGRDGVDQIAEALAGRTNISAIHIFSHGDSGKLNLGNTTLDVEGIKGRYAADMIVIRSALTGDGDMLVYGCDVAAGPVGQSFVSALAESTGADVAASLDATGAASSGGNWELEVKTGAIETSVLVPTNFVGLLAPPTIVRTSTDVFYVDFGISGTAQDITSAYASYQITNPTGSTTINDLWVQIGDFTDASATEATSVILGAKETNLVELGSLAAGSTKTAFFYLQAQFETLTAQTHTIRLYEGNPTKGGTLLNGAGSNFTFSQVTGVIEAGANKVNTTVAGPSPAGLGGLVTLTVTGDTGTIGAARVFSGSPATFSNWDANAYELVSSKYTFQYGAGTADDVVYTDQLNAVLASASATPYEAVYVFRAVGTTATPTALSPVIEISSGTQIKHTNVNSIAALAPLTSAENYLTLTKSTSTPLVAGGGTASYTLTFTNTSGQALVVDDVVDFLPSGLSYINGTSVYNGLAIANPTVSGSTLTWGNTSSFSVQANSVVTLTFNALAPTTSGSYVNQAVAHIGTVQIDTTTNTTDDAKASATLIVNDNPVARNDGPFTVFEDTPVSGNVLTNDTDPNSDALKVVQFVVSGVAGTFTAGSTATIPSVGALTINSDGSFAFTPATDYSGAVPSTTYTISDTLNATATATLSFANVTPINDAPAGTDATLTAMEDTARTFTAADFGFADPKDSPANTLQSVVIKTLPANGTILFNGAAITAGQEFTVAQLAQLTFTAAPNANGAAYTTFTFQVRDNGGTANGGVDLDQSPNTITLNVTAVNDAPLANTDSAAVTESGVNPGNSAFAGTPSASGNVLTNDTDPDAGDTKTVSQVNGAAGNVGSLLTTTYGSVTINANGTYTYTLNNALAATQALAQGQVVTEVITYRVRDTAGLFSDTTLTITVTGTNDAPVAVAAKYISLTTRR